MKRFALTLALAAPLFAVAPARADVPTGAIFIPPTISSVSVSVPVLTGLATGAGHTNNRSNYHYNSNESASSRKGTITRGDDAFDFPAFP